MRWINALERRFGHLAVPGLMRIVIACNLLVYLLLQANPDFVHRLTLRPERVFAGELWRLVSYVFIPQLGPGRDLGVIWLFLYLNLLWVMGEGLEQAWGSFKLNLFYLLGMIGTGVAVCVFKVEDATGFYLNASLILAFATLFPNFPILLYFIIPVPAKWMAALTCVFLSMSLLRGTQAAQLGIGMALVNYLIFFGPAWLGHWREQGRTAKRQQEFQMAQYSDDPDEALHHCKVCGRTEISAPDLEFRVASDGEEYCLAHLPSRRGLQEASPTLPQER